jgi:hypothetical protein
MIVFNRIRAPAGGRLLFLAFAHVEWDTFAQVMRDVELNPHDVLRTLEEHVQGVPASPGARCKWRRRRNWAAKLAFHQASRSGRQTIESSDLFGAGESGGSCRHHSPSRGRAIDARR